jgi:acetyl-CoA carboxylase biotin carboxyl carrier protein
MRTTKIRALIKLVEDSRIDELTVSSWGQKVCIRRKLEDSENNNGHKSQVVARVPDRVIEATVVAQTPASAPAVAAKTEAQIKRENLQEIKSPMVGTFYSAPAPDAKQYVNVGDKVNRGQVVCIIEAMKLMNEIESEFSGRVVETLVSNAQPVQFGQPLFLIEPA